MKTESNMVRHSTLLFLLLAGALSLALFVLKYQVQDLEDELMQLNRTIVSDTQAIHVLKAEWSHLNDPARLRALSERHLNLSPVHPVQLGTLEDLPETVPAAVRVDDFATRISRTLAMEKGTQ